MSKISYRNIKSKVNALAAKIDVPKDVLPYYRWSNGEDSPLIEIDDKGLHYINIESGKEIERKSTFDQDELLFWIFNDATFIMAIKFELKNRIENQDFRRIAFTYQEMLMGILSEQWKQRIQNEHLTILEKHPFND